MSVTPSPIGEVVTDFSDDTGILCGTPTNFTSGNSASDMQYRALK